MPTISKTYYPIPDEQGAVVFPTRSLKPNMIVKVNSEGMFSVDLPEYISAVLHQLPEYREHTYSKDWEPGHRRRNNKRGDTSMGMFAETKEKAVWRWKTAVESYGGWMKSRVEVKYLSVSVKYSPSVYRSHFTTEAILSYQYEVLYLIGKDWFAKSAAGRYSSRHVRDMKKVFLWTQEAEDYLIDMDERLRGLAEHIIEFFAKPAENIALALQSNDVTARLITLSDTKDAKETT